jgi:hypothetical protein
MARALSPWAAALLAGPCAYCGAPAGQRCVRADGTDQGHFHQSRFTGALSAAQAEPAVGFRPINRTDAVMEVIADEGLLADVPLAKEYRIQSRITAALAGQQVRA